MPGQTTFHGAQPVEYVEESSFATPETDPNMQWIGLVTEHSATEGVEQETINYAPENNGKKLDAKVNVKTGEMWEGEIVYRPQDWTWLQYWTGAAGDTGDDPSSIQIGEQADEAGEYRRILGCVGEEIEITVSEDEAFEVTASYLAADGEDWSTSDYIDSDTSDSSSGSHATEDSSDPFTYDDLANVQWNGSSLDGAIEEFTITISNDLTLVKDPDATADSNVAAIRPTTREITVEPTLNYNSMTMANSIRSDTVGDFSFDVGGTTFTVSNVKFPEFPYEMSSEDLVGDSVESAPAPSMAWA